MTRIRFGGLALSLAVTALVGAGLITVGEATAADQIRDRDGDQDQLTEPLYDRDRLRAQDRMEDPDQDRDRDRLQDGTVAVEPGPAP